MSKKKYEYGVWIAVIFFIFIMFFLINYFTPPIADDYNFIDHYKYNSNEKIQTIQDFFESIKTFYFSWGGRVIGYILMAGVHFLPLIVFDLLNTLAYLLLSILIYKICNMGNEKSILLFLFIHIALWLYIPDYGQVIFWTSGSVNYLWPSLFCLISIYIYRKYSIMKGEMLKSALWGIPLFLIGILSGVAMENTSAGMLVIMTLYLCYFKKKKIKIKVSMIALYIGSIIGYGILFFAPGNAVRADADERLGVFFKICIIGYYWIYFGLFLFGVCLLILFAQKKGLCKIDRERQVTAAIFWISSLCTVFCLVAAPTIPERAWYISTVYLTITTGILLRNMQVKMKELCKSFSLIAISVCSVFCIVSLLDTMISSYEISVQTKQRETYINEQIAEGKQDIVVPIIVHKYPFRSKHDALEGLSDITQDSTFWINTSLAKHYGVNSITGQ